MLDAVLVEPVDGIGVTQTSEGAGGCLEGGVERFDESGGGRVGKEDINGSADLSVITCEFGVKKAVREKTKRTTSSICAMRSSNLMNASSASMWVYSLK